MALLRIAKFSGNPLNKLIFPSPNEGIEIEKATLYDFMSYYNVNLMNPVVLTGIFIGSMLVFVFCAMTMKAVGKAAHSMVEEVRRQFKEIPGLLKGEPNAKADYASCVAISTQGAQKEMVVPSLLAIIVPIVVGLLLGVAGVIGMLAGGLSTGFVLAIMMSNAGGAWDNAKKYIESGQFGGKGSENHKAAVVGDTVGDPFKDTAGPSLNILIKLMSMVAVVIAGLTVNYSPKIQEIIGLNPKELSNRKAYAIVRGVQDTEDLYESKQNSSSIFEDPLLGTEDIILPTDEDMLRIKTSTTDTKEESKSASQTTAPAVSKSEKQETSGFDSGFGGGFDTPAQTNKKEETKPATSGGFDSGFGGGFDSFDAPATTEKKEEPKASEPAKVVESKTEEPKSDASTGFEGGFDSFDAPAATEKKEEAKSTEPSKVEEAPKAEEAAPAEPAKVEEAPKAEEVAPAEPAKVEEAPKAEETAPSEPAKAEEAPKAEETAPAEPAKDDNTAATKENSNTAEKKLEEIKTNISEKIENSLDKATEAIKEKVENKVEEKKDDFSGGFDNF
jgi:hypothetical protein